VHIILGGLFSGLILLLFASVLYVTSGLTNSDGLYVLPSLFKFKIKGGMIIITYDDLIETLNVNNPFLNLGVLFSLIGYLFKVSAADYTTTDILLIRTNPGYANIPKRASLSRHLPPSKRYYSTGTKNNLAIMVYNPSLDPWFITGFTDG
jgi:hypothetical protein